MTHSAVDIEGGLPAGTTSNYFRSKQALTTGTFDRLGDMLAAIIGNIGAAPVHNVEELIQTLGVSLGLSLGPGRTMASALAAMFTEAGMDVSLQPTARRVTELWWTAIAELMRSAGLTENVEQRAKWLLSYGNGLTVDQLAINDPDFDPVAAMRAAILGFAAPS